MQTNGVIVDGVANLYSQPSTETELVTQAILGTNVTIEQSQVGWHHLLLPDQYRGCLLYTSDAADE